MNHINLEEDYLEEIFPHNIHVYLTLFQDLILEIDFFDNLISVHDNEFGLKSNIAIWHSTYCNNEKQLKDIQTNFQLTCRSCYLYSYVDDLCPNILLWTKKYK